MRDTIRYANLFSRLDLSSGFDPSRLDGVIGRVIKLLDVVGSLNARAHLPPSFLSLRSSTFRSLSRTLAHRDPPTINRKPDSQFVGIYGGEREREEKGERVYQR